MSDVLKIAERACAEGEREAFSDGALKSRKGICAVAVCCDKIVDPMEFDPKKKLQTICLLFDWLDSLSAETVRDGLEGICKILDWLKPHVVQWDGELQQLLCCSHIGYGTFYKFLEEKNKWTFLYRTDILHVLKGHYDYSWYRVPQCLYYDMPQAGVKMLPEKTWCELIGFYSEKNVDYGVFAVGMFLAGYRKVIRILQERGLLTDDVKSKLASYVTEENRAWYCEITGEEVSPNTLMEQIYAQEIENPTEARESNALEFFKQNAEKITDMSLLERILHLFPIGLTFDKRFFENETLFRSALTSPAFYSTYLLSEEEDEVRKYFKLYYTADEMRKFALSHWKVFLEKKLYRVLPKALKDNIDFWVSLYEVRENVGVKPNDLKQFPPNISKNQEFLKTCTKMRCMDAFDFNKYYRYETQADIDYALQYAVVDVRKLPAWFTMDIINLLRVAENNSRYNTYDGISCLSLTLDSIPREKYGDKQFALIAENYQINKAAFYMRLDLSLRKDEEIWKFWLQGVALQKVESSIPAIVKKNKDFLEIVGK